MAEIHPILIAIHTLPHQGRRLLEEKWVPFLTSLRTHLLKMGKEAKGSSDALMLFHYPHPAEAITSIQEILVNLKTEFKWNPDSLGSLPIQFVIHFDKKDDHSATLRDASATLWDFLHQETIYITRPLQMRWKELMKDRELLAHTMEREGMGLFRLDFSDPNKEQVSLFPYRELASLGKERECFYCGMTNHVPSTCPSKILTMNLPGVSDVGYLPFKELGEIYKEVLAKQDKISAAIADGVKPTEIRKNPAMLIFIAYFDLFKLYQPRFLHKLTFGLFYKWEEVLIRSSKTVENTRLHLALDCLRVGQYDKAEKLFFEELSSRSGKHFYATVGLAFRAIELQRDNDVQTYLQRASEVASSETEKIYINLLLSRFSLLADDKWKAEQALEATFNIKQDCDEARYAKVQYQVRTGQSDLTFQELRMLAGIDKQYFMTMLMDPTLLPIHSSVEKILSDRLQILSKDAIDQLNKARAGYDELREWLREDDPELQKNNEALMGLEKQHKRRSYYDLLDVLKNAQAIYFACHQMRDKKLEDLANRLGKMEAHWQAHTRYWTYYPYQAFFGKFAVGLKKLSERIQLITKLADRRTGETYRAALKELDKMKSDLARLSKIIQVMVWTKIIMDGLRIFIKNILISETILVTLALLSYVGISTLIAGNPDSNLAQIMENHWFQKQLTFITTAVFAPFIALMMSIWEMKHRSVT